MKRDLRLCLITLVSLSLLGIGCACRTQPGPSDGWLRVTDAWNRNLVVSTPTAIGNAAGGVLAMPLWIVQAVVLAPVAVVSIDKYRELTGKGWNYTFATTSRLLGAPVGAPFIAPAFMLDDKPGICQAD